jgi:hypothetical protein
LLVAATHFFFDGTQEDDVVLKTSSYTIVRTSGGSAMIYGADISVMMWSLGGCCLCLRNGSGWVFRQEFGQILNFFLAPLILRANDKEVNGADPDTVAGAEAGAP